MNKPDRVAPLDDWLAWREYLMDLDVKPELGYIVNEELATADAVIASKHEQARDLCTMDDAPLVDNDPNEPVHSETPADDDLPF